MRRFSSILAAIGVAMLALSIVWFFVIGPSLVKYPSDLNSSASASGAFTLRFNAATAAPYATPVVLPLTVTQQLRSSASGSQRIVADTTTEHLGPYTVKYPIQYVISAGNVSGVRSPQSWSYKSTNVVDRSGTYTVNLPFGAGSGPYTFWEDQTASSFPVHQSGPDVTVDGMKLEVYSGTLSSTRITPAYVSVLQKTGLSSTITIAQLRPELAAAGVNLDQLLAGAATALPAAVPALQAAVAQPLPLDYYLAENVTIGVEPRTGAVVEAVSADQSVSARVSEQAIAGLGKALAPLASVPAFRTFGSALAKLNAPLPVFSTHFAGTPASVQGAVSVTAGYRDKIIQVEQTVPLLLMVGGLALLLIGGAMGLYGRRGSRGVPTAPEVGTTPRPVPQPV